MVKSAMQLAALAFGLLLIVGPASAQVSGAAPDTAITSETVLASRSALTTLLLDSGVVQDRMVALTATRMAAIRDEFEAIPDMPAQNRAALAAYADAVPNLVRVWLDDALPSAIDGVARQLAQAFTHEELNSLGEHVASDGVRRLLSNALSNQRDIFEGLTSAEQAEVFAFMEAPGWRAFRALIETAAQAVQIALQENGAALRAEVVEGLCAAAGDSCPERFRQNL